ncbi:MAG TPA: 3-hydroxyacyl-CoA dehydrogenase/enoyl-CoA hydratase family protein [Longimicrobiaceae bacterium]|nr:3-hydroxyacyl-CoA dehydrogenase/enoyl-CoA hydratase family protein [Longimicrobiaceae bacterium]
MRIRKLGVVGAGTMGSGIAALAASAGVPVVLLDVPGGGEDRDGLARKGVERALKARPAAFMDPERAKLIEIGNTEDDLERLGGCDWVVEVIIEQPEPKRALYARLESLLAPGAIVTTNTSGIPMTVLTEGRSHTFRRAFLGTHFFNPPRYMHLLELIPTPDTDPGVLRSIEEFGDRVLGKGIVRAKDAPGFVANRLGVYGMVQAIRLMEEHGLTIDEVDALTGPLIGRPKSATYRTADLTGLDVLSHVVHGLGTATGEELSLPDWVQHLVANGALGEKSGAGFYRKQGKQIETLDWHSGTYLPQQNPRIEGAAELAGRPLAQRLRGVLELPGEYGAFSRELFARTAHYVLEHTPELAYDLPSVDHAMEWGYGWDAGPFRQMDAVGLDRVKQLLSDQQLSLPPLLEAARGSFYEHEDGRELVLGLDGGYSGVERPAGVIRLASIHQQGRVLDEDREAALVDLGDGVALLEVRSKMGTLSSGVIAMLGRALARVEADGLAGLVIGHEDARTFSAGANLAEIAAAAQDGRWHDLETSVRTFQDAAMGLRRAPFPVVVAPFGVTLGGGAEMTLHADQVQAHAELYIGLVETGVGLIPAGGGTKELLFRFTEQLAPYEEADPFEAVKRAFGHIAMAKTSTSALEARGLGFLRDRDRISMNRDRLLADARQRVLDHASGYVPPPRRTITALGKTALGNLRYGIWAMREAGQITEHEVFMAGQLAYVLCGGDGNPREVSEQEILDLEREAFLRLLGTPETQERIAHMLKTGKPLRN